MTLFNLKLVMKFHKYNLDNRYNFEAKHAQCGNSLFTIKIFIYGNKSDVKIIFTF